MTDPGERTTPGDQREADDTVTFGAVGYPRHGRWDVTLPDGQAEADEHAETVVLGGDGFTAEEPDVAPTPQGRKQSLGRATALMASGTLVSRILGFVRQFLFSAVVASSLAADAFNVANTMPNYLLMVLNAGVLNAVLIPQITAAMKHDDGGQVYVDKLLTAAFGAIGALTLLGVALSPLLIRATSSLEGAALHLGILFGFICMPQILFYGLYSVLGNVLNARGQFAAFMWAPALANVVQIAGLVAFWVQWGQQTDPSRWSSAMVWTLAGSTTLGILAQALVLLPPLLRGGFRYRPRLGLRGAGLGSASKMLGWTLTALLISLAGGLTVQKVLTAVVNHVPAGQHVGGLSSYNYALLIFQLPHGLITVSILTALFPQMSRTWQEGDMVGMRRLLTRALSMPAVAVIPASAVLFVVAQPLVDVMLRLPADQARPVVDALRIMSVGILGFGLSTLQQRWCFAREAGRENLLYQVFLTAIQVSCALVALLVVPPRLALPVVALGLVVGNWAQSLLFIAVARRQLGGLKLGGVIRLWVRLLIASLLASGTGWLVVYGMRGFGAAWLLSVLTCALTGVAFGLVFLACSRVLHIREVDDMVAPVLRRLHLAH